MKGVKTVQAKLRQQRELHRLALHDESWWVHYKFCPHLVYANHQFGVGKADKKWKQLVDWLQFVGPPWKEARVTNYLRRHQKNFRSVLRWVEEGAHVDLRSEYGFELESESDVLEYWHKSSRAKFLELHGLRHANILLRPKFGLDDIDELFFSRLDLYQAKARDPLDPLCWHLLYLLMRDGTLDVRHCRSPGCGRFFKPKTKRKLYCSNLCRAKANAKSREAMRLYMRDYRRKKKLLARRKIVKGDVRHR